MQNGETEVEGLNGSACACIVGTEWACVRMYLSVGAPLPPCPLPAPGLHLRRPLAISAFSRDGGILNVRACLPLGASREEVGIVGRRFLLGEEGSGDM